MRRALLIALLMLGCAAGWLLWRAGTIGGEPTDDLPPGAPLDSLNGVVVYHNGGMGAVHGRHTVDGYNVGLRYQCVEFVKRYYLEHHHHRMPNSYGHAKYLFDRTLADSTFNPSRGLMQFTNGSVVMPRTGDLLVLDAWTGNAYGHVAIISAVGNGEVEVVQQNCGRTRERYDLDLVDGRWRIDHDRVLGWLRMP
ncbi:MAG: CHAP domain-containing protein [Flavobacteriales bacterium]|nr:CHAP domain-containing protein [Flavobacteriales bacterium]